MKLIHEYPLKVFDNEYEGKKFYKIGLSRREQDGKYTNGYIDARFRKGENIDTSKKIYIKEAWLDFYKKDKVTHPYIFISSYEYVSEAINKIVNDPFDDFSLTDEDLPF